MKESFEKLYKLMQLNCKHSSWVKETSLKQHVQELKLEVNEMIDEIDKDNKNFQEELGDVFWDTLKLMVIAENNGQLNIKDLFQEMHQKFTKRKPFLLEKRSVSREEESKIWKEVKEQEKKEKQNERI